MATPTIHVTEAARRAIEDALRDAGERDLRITISRTFTYELRVDSRRASDLVCLADGVTLLIDRESAQRADGLTIDFAEQHGFSIANPRAIPQVRPLSPLALKAMMDRGEPFELIDVRTEEERAIAALPGSRLLDRDGHAYLMSLDRSTTVVFHCHHGIRSQAAAEHCLREGFRSLYNLTGGIDAWAQVVDPSVPRY